MSASRKWRVALQLAPNSKAVQGIIRSYVDERRPLLGVLPAECRMALDEQDPDIQSAAVTLLQAELRFAGPEDVRELLHELAYTFASAAVRITLLHEIVPAANASRYDRTGRTGRNGDRGVEA